MVIEYVSAFLYSALGILGLYVVYKIARLADIFDTIKRKYEAEAKTAEIDSQINLTLAKKLASRYGVDFSVPAKVSTRETLMKKLEEVKEEKPVKKPL